MEVLRFLLVPRIVRRGLKGSEQPLCQGGRNRLEAPSLLASGIPRGMWCGCCGRYRCCAGQRQVLRARDA